MKFENVSILSSKFGLKIISAKYYDNLVGQNRSAEETEFPHPDLINARDAIKPELAKAFYLEGEERDHFTVTGFLIEEKDEIVTVDIHGKMDNVHEYSTNVKSGRIPLDEDQEVLKEKLEVIKKELYLFLFENKSAQGKIPGFEDIETESVSEEKSISNFEGEPPVQEPSVN